jgi:hypothetical protein
MAMTASRRSRSTEAESVINWGKSTLTATSGSREPVGEVSPGVASGVQVGLIWSKRDPQGD